MIILKHVTCSYENTLALDDITLSIEKGEVVFFTGPNGSGKSTLFKVLNGLVFPVKGTYTFDHIEITANQLKNIYFAKTFHQKMGYIFQNTETQLFCGTVYDEVAFGPRQMGLMPDEVDIRVRQCLDMLCIAKLFDRAPYQLSGGEKKRVAIAAVLSLNPEVLMLDEPFNGLDEETHEWLCSFLKVFHASGKTIILATHDNRVQNKLPGRIIHFNSHHRIQNIE